MKSDNMLETSASWKQYTPLGWGNSPGYDIDWRASIAKLCLEEGVDTEPSDRKASGQSDITAPCIKLMSNTVLTVKNCTNKINLRDRFSHLRVESEWGDVGKMVGRSGSYASLNTASSPWLSHKCVFKFSNCLLACWMSRRCRPRYWTDLIYVWPVSCFLKFGLRITVTSGLLSVVGWPSWFSWD